MDFKNLNGVWKLKRLCMTCIELVFEVCLGEFCFQFEFCLNLDFQMQKTIVIFEILFIGDYI